MEDRVGKWALDVEELENSESDLVENKDEECALVEDEMERLRSSWRLVITYKIRLRNLLRCLIILLRLKICSLLGRNEMREA